MTPDEIDRLSRVAARLGTVEFGPAVDAFLGGIVEFDMSCIFGFHRTSPPLLIHDGYSASVSRSALNSYLRGAYLLDPFYVACTTDADDGLWRMSDIAPDEFFASDFAGSQEVHPCISDQSGTLVEEIGYVVTLSDSWRVTYSLMRNRSAVQFSASEFALLSGVCPLVAATVRRHVELSSMISTEPTSGGVGSALQTAFGDDLTPAQFRVVNLILRGHSNQSVARELHITEGTVKLHRHNAYQRLGLASQAELFRRFIDALESPESL